MVGVRRFTFSLSRHSVSGTEGCLSFVHSGSTIWRNSRPQPGPCLPAESLLVVLDMACGRIGSSLGSQIRLMAVQKREGCFFLRESLEGLEEGHSGIWRTKCT